MALRERRVGVTQNGEGLCQGPSLSFSNMAQKRLNNLLILHVHRDRTDEIPFSEVLNDFVSKDERGSNVFVKVDH